MPPHSLDFRPIAKITYCTFGKKYTPPKDVMYECRKGGKREDNNQFNLWVAIDTLIKYIIMIFFVVLTFSKGIIF